MTIYPQIGDTEEIDQLIARHEERSAIALEAIAAQRQIEREVDELRLATRPTYPTHAHRAGALEIIRQIEGGVIATSIHGHTVTPGVTVDPKRLWMHFSAGAPYRARGGHKLWSFSEEDVVAILALFEGSGYEVARHWLADNGVSLNLRKAGA